MINKDINKRVLVAEDNEQLRNVYEAIFRHSDNDYDVTIVVNGQAAYDAFCEKSFDLVVTDMNMPGLTGMALYKKINEDCISADKLRPAFLFVSGVRKALENMERECSEEEGCRLLMKPFNPAQFESAVTELLG